MQTAFLVVTLTLGAPAAKEPKSSPIVGTWLIQSFTQDGKTHEIKGDHCWTFTADGRREAHTLNTEARGWQKYELNEKTRPPSVAVIHEENGRQTREHFLFEIDGDTLKLCTRDRGFLPTEITAGEGSGNKIYTLKRVPKKD